MCVTVLRYRDATGRSVLRPALRRGGHNAKVSQERIAATVQEDVRGFDILVDDAVLVGGVEMVNGQATTRTASDWEGRTCAM